MFTVIALSVFPLVVSVVWVLYRIGLYFWDPKGLRKYPGLNPLCGFTNLAYIWAIGRAGGFRTKTLAEAHRSHKVIRLGPNSLSFADVRAIKDIYGHSTSCTKGDMYSTTAGSHRSLLDSVDKLEHSVKRKRLAAAFSAKHLENWEFKVHDKCTRLIAQLDRYCLFPREMDKSEYQLQPNIIDWRHWSNLFTVEAISDIAVSQRLGLMEAGNAKMLAEDAQGNSRTVNFVESLHGIGRMAAPIVWSGVGYPVLKKSVSIASPSYRQQVICNDNYDDIIRHLVSKRMAQYRSGIKHDDFFACLLEDKQGESTNLNLGEIASEVNVFMNAGSDTTAIALTHILYYLLKNPEKLKILRAQLDADLDPTVVVPTYTSVRNIAYLRACLDESLRLSPPVAFGLQRKTPPEGSSIQGTWVAGNTHVSVPAYIAHRDAAIFPDPESFIPERWLKEEAKEIQKYFIPFSAGSRGCIGRNISYIEQHVLVATMVRRYDMALLSEGWELEWEERFNLWPKPLPIIIERR